MREISRFQVIGTELGSCAPARAAPHATRPHDTIELIMRRVFVVFCLIAAIPTIVTGACSRTPSQPPAATTAASPQKAPASTDLAYVCPMDPDIRSSGPGKCPRCGMALVAGSPVPRAYHLDRH